MMQQSVVLVKPDGLQRGLIGEIISRFERKGLKLIALKMTVLTHEVLDAWYVHHKEKPGLLSLGCNSLSETVRQYRTTCTI